MMEFLMRENGYTAQFEYGKLDISGDETFGFRPYQLLVSSVVVCSGGVLRQILHKQRIAYNDITIKADVERNPEGAKEIKRIHIHFIIQGADVSEKKMDRAMQLSRKYCSMVQSVKDSIQITESYELHSS